MEAGGITTSEGGRVNTHPDPSRLFAEITITGLQAHITRLLVNNQISVEWKPGTSGRSWRKTRSVRLSPVKSEITYAIALHEIGHILGDYPKTRIDKEVAAWQWAKTYALTWTPTMQAAAVKRLGNYIAWSRRHQTMRVPGPGHPIYKWVSA